MSLLLQQNLDTATELAKAAIQLDEQKKYAEAIPKYKRVVEIYLALFSKARTDIRPDFCQEKLKEAERYMQRIERIKGMVTTVEEESTPARKVAFESRPNVRFDDIIGNDEVKVHLRDQIIRRIQHPELFKDTVMGCLLYGPPGTGKTHIARCLAGETGLAFIAVKPSDIQNKHVGESEANVKRLFEEARERAPVIIFIDEADSLLRDRGKTEHSHNTSVFNEFLQQWDGFTKNPNVFVVGATNRPQDIDEAAMRRFGKTFYVGLPTYLDRLAMLRAWLPDAQDGIEYVAENTEWFSGDNLRKLIESADTKSRTEMFDISRFVQRDGLWNLHYCMNCFDTKTECHDCGSKYIAESDIPPNTLNPPPIRIDHVIASLDDVRVNVNPRMLEEFERWRQQL